MTTLLEAKTGMRELGTKAAAVTKDATLTPAEQMTRLEAYHVDLKAFQDIVAIHESAERLMKGGESVATPEGGEGLKPLVKSLGQQLITSDAFKKSQAHGTTSQFSFASDIGMKVATTINEGTTISNGQLNGSGGVLALPQYQPGIVDIRFAALAVSELFATGTTSSPIVSYVKEATETQGAAARAEQATAGQSDATFVRVNEQVGNIAAFFKMTGEMLQDDDQAESFMSNRLIAQVGREEENEVLNGTGYPALPGILGRSGLQTALSAGTTGTLANPMLLAEAIHQQVTFIRTTAFVEPDAVILNPTRLAVPPAREGRQPPVLLRWPILRILRQWRLQQCGLHLGGCALCSRPASPRALLSSAASKRAANCSAVRESRSR